MSRALAATATWTEPLRSAAPTWWVVFSREITDLWVGGKALTLTLIYSILLGIQTYVLASNSELSLLPPKEMVYETLKGAHAVAMFIGLIIGADSLSGERERGTLEGLLLTPTSRLQIIIGKFLAGASAWPAAMAISIPYMWVLSQGDEVFGPAVRWGAIVGTLLVPGFVALGMVVSYWCSTNKTSMFVSLGVYLLMLLPSQLPGRAQTGPMGSALQGSNPMAAPAHFLSKVLVNNNSVADWWPWLIAPAVFSVLVLCVLIFYCGPGLRLEPGRASKVGSALGRFVGASAIAGLMMTLAASPVMALQDPSSTTVVKTPLHMSTDVAYRQMKAQDNIIFNTTVTNHGTTEIPLVIVAMNIVSLSKGGIVVDPEDWSPLRTQNVVSLGAGQSATHSWRVNAIWDGDYMVYIVALPDPGSPTATSQPIASSAVHLTVTPFTKLNPGGVLPYAIGGPVLMAVAVFLVFRRRRRQIDAGGPK